MVALLPQLRTDDDAHEVKQQCAAPGEPPARIFGGEVELDHALEQQDRQHFESDRQHPENYSADAVGHSVLFGYGKQLIFAFALLSDMGDGMLNFGFFGGLCRFFRVLLGLNSGQRLCRGILRRIGVFLSSHFYAPFLWLVDCQLSDLSVVDQNCTISRGQYQQKSAMICSE